MFGPLFITKKYGVIACGHCSKVFYTNKEVLIPLTKIACSRWLCNNGKCPSNKEITDILKGYCKPSKTVGNSDA